MAALQVCKRYDAEAKRKVQEWATLLPGTCDLSWLERLESPEFRCTISELDSAVYIERGNGTKLCGTCYQRITAQAELGQMTRWPGLSRSTPNRPSRRPDASTSRERIW